MDHIVAVPWSLVRMAKNHSDSHTQNLPCALKNKEEKVRSLIKVFFKVDHYSNKDVLIQWIRFEQFWCRLLLYTDCLTTFWCGSHVIFKYAKWASIWTVDLIGKTKHYGFVDCYKVANAASANQYQRQPINIRDDLLQLWRRSCKLMWPCPYWSTTKSPFCETYIIICCTYYFYYYY